MRKAAADPFGEHEPARPACASARVGWGFHRRKRRRRTARARRRGLRRHAEASRSSANRTTSPCDSCAHLTRKHGGIALFRQPPVLGAGAGLLCATVDAGSFAVMDVPMSRALICVSNAMLRHRYHARYELVELVFSDARRTGAVAGAAARGMRGYERPLRAADGRKRDGQEHAQPARIGRRNAARLGRQRVRGTRRQSRHRRAELSAPQPAGAALLAVEGAAAVHRTFTDDRATQRGAQVRGRSAQATGQDRARAAATRGDRFLVAASGGPAIAAARARVRSSARAAAPRAALRVSATELERIRAAHRRRAGVRAAPDGPRRRRFGSCGCSSADRRSG